MVIEFVTTRYYKSHELAQASLLWGTVAQVSDVAHGPIVEIDATRFEKLCTLKKIQCALNMGPDQRTLRKTFFFQSALR